VVDEYTYNCERDRVAIVGGIAAQSRWVLSGTPDVSSFRAVADLGTWLRVNLGRVTVGDLPPHMRKRASPVQAFEYFCERTSAHWHAERAAVARNFLGTFVRQNTADLGEIPCTWHTVPLLLPPDERSLYSELEGHLVALDLVGRGGGARGTAAGASDREARLRRALAGAASADEALLKRCAQGAAGGDAAAVVALRASQLDECARDVARLVAHARGAIGAFDAAHTEQPEADPRQLWPRTHLAQWLNLEVSECGDTDAAARLQAAIAEGQRADACFDGADGGLPLALGDAMAWGRDKVHALRRVQKEIVGRVRSLRYFEAVHRATAGAPWPVGHAVLATCGHTAPLEDLQRCAVHGAPCPHPGCDVTARAAAVVALDPFRLGARPGATAPGPVAHGVKLSALCALLDALPEGEGAVVLVQFADLPDAVRSALIGAGHDVAWLHGSARQRSDTVAAFQRQRPGDGRILLLNATDESAAGANLTNASHCVFVHPLLTDGQHDFDAWETQAVGRVRRYGQVRVRVRVNPHVQRTGRGHQ